MHQPEGDRRLKQPRRLTVAERCLINAMLKGSFEGRDELRSQLEETRIVAVGPVDTRTIVFAAPARGEPRAHVIQRVPVDASMPDLDGTGIDVLMHVVDGYAHELEAYRVDGEPIERTELDGPLNFVNWYPLSFD